MNTDMNQYLISGYVLACLSIIVRKMTAYQLNSLCWASSLAICAYRAHFQLHNNHNCNLWCMELRGFNKKTVCFKIAFTSSIACISSIFPVFNSTRITGNRYTSSVSMINSFAPYILLSNIKLLSNRGDMSTPVTDYHLITTELQY